MGSLLRTCDGLGIQKVYLTGYTPYPHTKQDIRLPHEAMKIHKQIVKTALGAEATVDWTHEPNVFSLLARLKKEGYTIAALEQTEGSTPLPDFRPQEKTVIVLGREVEGISKEVMDYCDIFLEIPMLGKKESFNVVQAAAITLYHCRFIAT